MTKNFLQNGAGIVCKIMYAVVIMTAQNKLMLAHPTEVKMVPAINANWYQNQNY